MAAARKARSAKRKVSSPCSKRYPCVIVTEDGKTLKGTFKTYNKYGKNEWVRTDMPPRARAYSLKSDLAAAAPGKRRARLTEARAAFFARSAKATGRPSRSSAGSAGGYDSELARARAVADAAMTPAERKRFKAALRRG